MVGRRKGFLWFTSMVGSTRSFDSHQWWVVSQRGPLIVNQRLEMHALGTPLVTYVTEGWVMLCSHHMMLSSSSSSSSYGGRGALNNLLQGSMWRNAKYEFGWLSPSSVLDLLWFVIVFSSSNLSQLLFPGFKWRRALAKSPSLYFFASPYYFQNVLTIGLYNQVFVSSLGTFYRVLF